VIVTDKSEDRESLAIIESMRPDPELSRRIGPGGSIRELGHFDDVRPREGLLFAHDEVRDHLRKTRKLLVSSCDCLAEARKPILLPISSYPKFYQLYTWLDSCRFGLYIVRLQSYCHW
jgi:hypothetical protein